MVWRLSQQRTRHPSSSSLLSFPDPCCENTKLILTVNSGADRYSLTISLRHKTSRPGNSTCHCGSPSPSRSITNRPEHIHEECTIREGYSRVTQSKCLFNDSWCRKKRLDKIPQCESNPLHECEVFSI